jgi:hypothetical protein
MKPGSSLASASATVESSPCREDAIGIGIERLHTGGAAIDAGCKALDRPMD